MSYINCLYNLIELFFLENVIPDNQAIGHCFLRYFNYFKITTKLVQYANYEFPSNSVLLSPLPLLPRLSILLQIL